MVPEYGKPLGTMGRKDGAKMQKLEHHPSWLASVAAVVLVATGGAYIAPDSGSGSAPQHAELLPAHCLAALTLDGSALVNHAADLALSKLVSDPLVSPVLRPLLDLAGTSLDTILSEIGSPFGMVPHELLELLKNRITVALLDFEGWSVEGAFQSDVVVLLDFAAAMGGARGFLEVLEKVVLKFGAGRFEDRTISGATIREYIPPAASPIRAWYTIHQGTLILTTRVASMEGILARLKTGDKAGSLSQDSHYVAVAGKWPEGRTLGALYLSVNRIRAVVVEEGSEESSFVELLGLDRIVAAGLAVSVHGSGFREHLYVHLPEGGPLRSLLDPGEWKSRIAGWLPSSTAAAIAGWVPLERASLYARQASEALGVGGYVEGWITEASEFLGIDWDQLLLPSVGEELGVGLSWSGTSLIPSPFLVIATRMEEGMDRVARGLAKKFFPNAAIRAISEVSETFHHVEPNRVPGQANVGFVPEARAAWSLNADRLVVSAWPDAIRKYIRWKSKPDPTLETQAEFVRLRAELVPAEEKLTGFAWCDLPRIARFLLDSAAPILQSAALPAPFDGIEMALWPGGDEVARHLSGAMVATSWSGQGWSVRTSSRVGVLVPLGALLFGAPPSRPLPR